MVLLKSHPILKISRTLMEGDTKKINMSTLSFAQTILYAIQTTALLCWPFPSLIP